MKLSIDAIDVGERIREDLGDIESLAINISRRGLLYPIILQSKENPALVDGQRRLMAFRKLGLDSIEVKFYGELTDDERKEIELESNLLRKDFTWEEKITGILDLFDLKVKLYGQAVRGHGGGYSMQDLANFLGVSVGSVSESLTLARAVRDNPDLAAEGTKKAAFRRMKKSEEDSILEEMAKRVKVKADLSNFINGDCTLELKKLADASVDMVLTDPPFGKELEFTYKDKGEKKPYQDDAFSVMECLDLVFKEAFRVLKLDRVMLVFFDIINYVEIVKLAREAGFFVDLTPIIFTKEGTAGLLGEESWYARNYEMVLHCQKGRRAPNKRGMPNVVREKRVPAKLKIHPTQKPAKLMRYFIEQHTLPGELVIDPFAGSASTLVAAYSCNREAWGCELSPEYYQKAVIELERFTKERNERVPTVEEFLATGVRTGDQEWSVAWDAHPDWHTAMTDFQNKKRMDNMLVDFDREMREMTTFEEFMESGGTPKTDRWTSAWKAHPDWQEEMIVVGKIGRKAWLAGRGEVMEV